MTTEHGVFFKSAAHQKRFLAAMRDAGKVEDTALDPEYAAALYILTADTGTWEKANESIDGDSIDMPLLLTEVDFSGGYSVLIRLAGNLFNGQLHLDPLELYRLDSSNFTLAMTALWIRRETYHLDDFTA